MNITVIGTGYVGLVTGACLADAGNNVFCVDVDVAKMALLAEGRIPIFEPGLEAIVQRNRAAGRLQFSTDIPQSVAHAELQIIAVGTPPGEDGSADLQHVVAAARAIGRLMDGYKVVVTKSTVPVGTADKGKQADIEEVRRGIGSDPRIGYQFLYAGAGFGGSCFPKDVKALQRSALEAGKPLRVLAAVDQVNEAQKHVLGDKIRKRFGPNLSGRRFAVWGLAFKANTDDMREAPSRALIGDLIGAGASIRAYDPVAGNEAKKIFAHEKRLQVFDSALAALEGADALAIMTEAQEFRSPDFAAMKSRLKTPAIFDGRNLYDPAVVRAQGIEQYPIGREKEKAPHPQEAPG